MRDGHVPRLRFFGGRAPTRPVTPGTVVPRAFPGRAPPVPFRASVETGGPRRTVQKGKPRPRGHERARTRGRVRARRSADDRPRGNREARSPIVRAGECCSYSRSSGTARPTRSRFLVCWGVVSRRPRGGDGHRTHRDPDPPAAVPWQARPRAMEGHQRAERRGLMTVVDSPTVPGQRVIG